MSKLDNNEPIFPMRLDEWSDHGQTILCPYCDFDYNHTGTIKTIESHDDYAAGWWGRGDLIVIAMQCEEQHMWEMCIGFHKGNLYTFARKGTEVILKYDD